MKVLFISHMGNRTGAPLALLSVIKGLKMQMPDLLCDFLFLEDGSLVSEFSNYGNVIIWRNKFDIISRIRRKLKISDDFILFRRIASRGTYNLLYANTVCSLEMGVRIKKKMILPLILHLHESEYLVSSLGVTESQIYACDKIIAVSDFAARNIINKYHYNSDNIFICPPKSPLIEGIQFNGHLTNNPIFRIGFAGASHWVKSIDRLPLLISTFLHRYPNVPCLFQWVGELHVEDYSRLMFEINKFGLIDYSSFASNLSR